MSGQLPDGISIQGQRPIMAYDEKYAGLSWLQRTLGDPPQSVKDCDRPIDINGVRRYVTPDDLQTMSEALDEGKKIYFEGQEVTDLDINPGGANRLYVSNTRGRTSMHGDE